MSVEKMIDNYEKTEGKENQAIDRSLADLIYVFCPSMELGFRFYDETPRNYVAESVPMNIFWSKEEQLVAWDDTINGKRNNDLLFDTRTAYLVNSNEVTVSGSKSYNIYTIMVSDTVFLDLLQQIDEPEIVQEDDYRRYKKLDFHAGIFSSLNDNTDVEYLINEEETGKTK